MSPRRATAHLLLAAVFLAAQALFFVPLAIYAGNVDEMAVGLPIILRVLLLPAGVAIAALLVVGLLLRGAWAQRYVALLYGLGLLAWAEGLLIVWDYGLVGKGDIAWERYAARGLLDAALWAAVVLGAVLLPRGVLKAAPVVFLTMLASQGVLAAAQAWRQPAIWGSRDFDAPGSLRPPPAISALSTRQNVIHVILDELQSDVFLDYLGRHPEMRRALEGGTLYRNASGSFPTTVMSLPALFSGRVYENDVPIDRFLDEVASGPTLINLLQARGFAADLVVPGPSTFWRRVGYSHHYQVPVPYKARLPEFQRAQASRLLNLALFRLLPHHLKRVIAAHPVSLSPEGVDRAKQQDYEAMRNLAMRDVFRDLIRDLDVSREEPVYKLVHLTSTHWPAVLDGACGSTGRVLPWTWVTIAAQAECTLDLLTEFLGRLRELGVYDEALILIHADHGYWHVPDSGGRLELLHAPPGFDPEFGDRETFAQVVASSAPLLLLKPPRARGELAFSDAPVMLTDIPATVAATLGFEAGFGGVPLQEAAAGMERERRFAYYDAMPRADDAYFDSLTTYTIRGNLRDRRAWQRSGVLVRPDLRHETRRLEFDPTDPGFAYGVGWNPRGEAQDGVTYTWALGGKATLFLKLPAGEALTLRARMKTPPFPQGQRVRVTLDGRELGAWDLVADGRWEWETHELAVPPDPDRKPVSTLELAFSAFRAPDAGEARSLAVLFDYLTFETANP